MRIRELPTEPAMACAPEPSHPLAVQLRRARPGDVTALAELMIDAYRGTIDFRTRGIPRVQRHLSPCIAIRTGSTGDR
jgi:hypothetical protein